MRDWGILPEIEDDDSDSEDGYDELKTPELEEDQIAVVNKGLLQRKNFIIPQRKKLHRRDQTHGSTRGPRDFLGWVPKGENPGSPRV